MVMQRTSWGLIAVLTLLIASPVLLRGGDERSSSPQNFQTSDRCVACHNGMKTEAGADYSIGLDWRASIMANSSRDPSWQGNGRRGDGCPSPARNERDELEFHRAPGVPDFWRGS